MKSKRVLFGFILLTVFFLGISTGLYQHLPIGLNDTLNNSSNFIPESRATSKRNFDVSQKTETQIDISARTGIYITYGQSNAANHGEIGYVVTEDVHQFLAQRSYRYEDPSLGATGLEGSVWGMVGDKLIREGIHDQVIFANTAWGGRNINELKSDAYLRFLKSTYTSLIKKYGRVNGILFHQGEADNNPNGVENYYSGFVEFIESLHASNIYVPVYLSRASFCNEKLRNENLTDIQDQLIHDFQLIFKGPNTDLIYSPRDRRFDYCHFSLEGYDKFSDMWVESIRQATLSKPQSSF